MALAAPQPQPQSRRRIRRPGRAPAGAPAARPWPVTAIALLLILESVGFLAAGALYIGPLGIQWHLTPEVWEAQRIAVLTGVSFALLALLGVVAALGLLRLARTAWLTAVLVQGGNLALALLLYFRGRPAYVYLMMLFGIVMVLYLHQADVQAAFRPKAETSPTEVEIEP